MPQARCDVEIALMGNNIHINNQTNDQTLDDDLKQVFIDHWDKFAQHPLDGRDRILRDFCPQVYGMYIVKLAVMLVLIGGVAKLESGMSVRGDAHLLLVGDP